MRPEGIAIINNQVIPPLSVSLGSQQYPSDVTIEEILRRRTGHIYFVDGANKAGELGDIRALNMFMLGCVSSLLPIDVHIWMECMTQHIPSNILQVNITAFEQGRKEASSVNIG